MMNIKTEKWLCIILASCAIISALIGLFYFDGGESFFATNVYGNPVELYGNGIYAYNSKLTVSSRMGADWMGIFGGVFLIFLCIGKRIFLWKDILKTAQVTTFTYYFACLTFSIQMNRLYLIYVLGFGVSIVLAVHMLVKYFKQIVVKDGVKEKRNMGVSLCLIISGGITIIIWLSMIIPHLINQSYGDLLNTLTTEATYAIDLGLLCPLMIMCGLWIWKKNDIGYKLAPILLYILCSVAPMVILQNLYCIKLGIAVEPPVFVGTVLSFVIMGTFACCYLKKSVGLLICS